MGDSFDPYYTWLGIPPVDQPPDLYRLLGIERFEENQDAISNAADQRMAHLRTLDTGKRQSESQRLLNEVAQARIVLLNRHKKAAYDTRLRGHLSKKQSTSSSAAIPNSSPILKATPLASVRPLPAKSAPANLSNVGPNNPPTRPWPILAAAGVVLVVVIGLLALMLAGESTDEQPSITRNDAAIDANKDSGLADSGMASRTEGNQTQGNQPKELPKESVQGATTTPSGIIKASGKKRIEHAVAKDPAAVESPDAVERVEDQGSPESDSDKIGDSGASEDPEIRSQENDREEQTTQPDAANKLAVKAPIPNDTAQQEARALVAEVFKEELRAAATREEKQALVEFLLKNAAETADGVATRYVLYDLARKFAVETGSAGLIERSVDGIDSYYDVDDLRLKASALYEAGRVTLTSDDHRELIAASMSLVEEAVLMNRFDIALPMEQVLMRSASRVRDGKVLKLIRDRMASVKVEAQRYEEFTAAKERLSQDPNDADANAAVGKYLALVKGRWKEGMQYLIRCSEPALQTVAEADLADPTVTDEQLELADGLYALATKYAGTSKVALLKRSLFWYSKATEHQSGLQKVKTDKRISQLTEQLTDLSHVTSKADDTQDSISQKSDSGTDWKRPGKNSNALFRSFLGVYRHGMVKGKYYPFVNLNVPNANLWSKETQDRLRGHIPFEEIAYTGTAKIIVPEDGVYILGATRGCSISINGKDTGGSGEIRIVRGVHTVKLSVGTHGNPNLHQARISLRHKETGEEVPFVNSWQDILSFTGSVIAGVKVNEVSGWKPTSESEVKIDQSRNRR